MRARVEGWVSILTLVGMGEGWLMGVKGARPEKGEGNSWKLGLAGAPGLEHGAA